MKKALAVSVAVLLLSACTSMQGVVRDKETGTPVASALVQIEQYDGSTDALGRYKVTGAFVPGDTMMVNAPGYNIYTRSVKSATEIVDVELTKKK